MSTAKDNRALKAVRPFRGEDSFAAERAARDAVPALLAQRGFSELEDVRKAYGGATSQVVRGRDVDGVRKSLHVRTCWRRDPGNGAHLAYSATQLAATTRAPGDWVGTLDFIAGRERDAGNTHTLIVQHQREGFAHAALIPCDLIKPIWERQRDISTALVAQGLSGRRRKNHAENGKSPTLWLQDDRGPASHEVADALWSYPGVVDLLARPASVTSGGDAMDDCPIDAAELGRDAAARRQRVVSGFPRDQAVRGAVLARARGCCERQDCGMTAPFTGFLDVHHILGVAASDRYWNCVALCPNCHRQAHGPDSAAINDALQAYADDFRPGDIACDPL